MTAPPPWLEALAERVANSVEAHSPSTLGYRYWPVDDDELWEIMLYPMPVELRGGAEDGAVVAPGFSLDLKSLCEAFDAVEAVYWTAHSFGPHDQDNPSVSIEGRYQGQAVYLRILAYAPDDEPPGMTLDLPPQNGDSIH